LTINLLRLIFGEGPGSSGIARGQNRKNRKFVEQLLKDDTGNPAYLSNKSDTYYPIIFS